MPCQERHAMLRAAPGRRFATHRVDKLRRRAEVSPSSASSLSVRCRAEVIIAHTPSTLFTYETPTLIVEKSIARLALGSADTNTGDPLLHRVKIQRRQFNEPLEVRRRLTRILMSYCVPLKEAMRTRGPAALMRIIRDAMIVYYEAYKRPESGFIHGGKHPIL